MKKGFVTNIEKDTLENENFRKVLYTSKYGQVVVMSLLPNEDIGMEVHEHVDQFFRIDSGEGKVIIDGEESVIEDGFAIVVPAGSQHNVINTSSEKPLKLYTIYMPPNHKDGIIHKTKAEAEIAETDGSDIYEG
jgi:mannose-6-phosphate isomerase-like protein (cupin superfamily)